MPKCSDVYMMVAARFVMGFIFLWAFLDKLFGWGFATTPDAAWVNGGSPTAGFLKFGVTGPLANFFHSLAGSAVVEWLFMVGLAGIGLALIFGVGIKIAGFAGTILMLLMWSALLFPKNNPIFDEHIVQAIVLFGLVLTNTKPGQYFGLGRWWGNTSIVTKYSWLE